VATKNIVSRPLSFLDKLFFLNKLFGPTILSLLSVVFFVSAWYQEIRSEHQFYMLLGLLTLLFSEVLSLKNK